MPNENQAEDHLVIGDSKLRYAPLRVASCISIDLRACHQYLSPFMSSEPLKTLFLDLKQKTSRFSFYQSIPLARKPLIVPFVTRMG